MRVFVTGGAGYIGSAVVRALVEAGHEVTALVRSSERERAVTDLGAEPAIADIKDAAAIERLATAHDAAIHTAFEYSAEAVAADRSAVNGLLAGFRNGRGPRSLVYTSGCWVLGNTGDEAAGEDTPIDHPAPVVAWRPAQENLVLRAAGGTLVTAVIRPGMVYGGKAGLVTPLFESALRDGAAVHVGDGRNRWSLVHRDDLAQLYRLVIERRAGRIFHGVDGAALPVAEVARLASEAAGAGGRTRSVPVEEARQKLGPVADALVIDQVLGRPRATELGWEVRYPSFVEGARAAFREFEA